jgi:hypothetical protein
MGLDFNGARFLLYAHRLGINFERTVMLGRQSLDLTKAEFSTSLSDPGYSLDNELINKIFTTDHGYAELFLEYLGAAYSGCKRGMCSIRAFSSRSIPQYPKGGSMKKKGNSQRNEN